MKKLLVSLAILAMVLATAPPALAEEGFDPPKGAMIVIDLIIVRPVAYLALFGGAVLYIPSAFVNALGGNEDTELKESLINRPYRFAVERPLGKFEEILD